MLLDKKMKKRVLNFEQKNRFDNFLFKLIYGTIQLL